MGGAPSQEANPNAGKPLFFLASCPPGSLEEAVALSQRYGGFHCVGSGTGSSLSSRAPFAAWKATAEAQFMTLRQLSTAGQKVFGIAIAGFGQTNDERQFLMQLHMKQGHEQFVLKQCGDVEDFERWLQSQGYRPLPGGRGVPPPQPPAEPPVEQGSAWATSAGAVEAAPRKLSGHDLPRERADEQQGVWASIFGTHRPERERHLADVHRALQDAAAADEASLSELRELRERLEAAVRTAADAGVLGDDLHEAEVRIQELSRLIQIADKTQASCWSCCCSCCGSSRPQSAAAELAVVEGEPARPPAPHGAHQTCAGQDAAEAPDRAGAPLRPGTRCRYYSSTWGTYMPTTVVCFNAGDSTFDLKVRQHARVSNISPDPSASASQAWPPGTPVEYESSSAKSRLPAVVVSYNAPAGSEGAQGTYNLDVRQAAPADRVFLRLPKGGVRA